MDAHSLQPCAICGKGVMHAGLPIFWQIDLARMGVDPIAARQLAGMEMMMGGNVALARVLAPTTPIARPIGERRTILVCESCASESTSVYQLGLPD